MDSKLSREFNSSYNQYGSVSEKSEQLTHLEREYENARERLQQQRETLDSLSNNSYRIARLEFILIGVIVTVLSTVRGDSQIMKFLSESSTGMFGIGLVLASTILFVLSTLGERIYVETVGKPDDIRSVLSGSQSREEYFNIRLENYESRITYNDDLMEHLGRMMSFGTLFMIAGFLVFGYGVLQKVTSQYLHLAALVGPMLLVLIFTIKQWPTPSDDVDPVVPDRSDD